MEIKSKSKEKEMKKAKKLTAILLVCGLALVLAACGEPKIPVDTEMYPEDANWEILTAKHEGVVEITMWIPNSATSTMGTGIQALADAFNAEQAQKYPGKNIVVTVEYQGKSGTLNEKLQAAIISGNNPVISAVGVSSVPLYQAKALDLRNVFTYDELQAQNQGLLQYSLYNGKFMLNPFFPSASNIIIANKSLFDAKGITLPTAQSIIDDPEGSNWTWEEFKRITSALTDEANGVYGFATSSLDPGAGDSFGGNARTGHLYTAQREYRVLSLCAQLCQGLMEQLKNERTAFANQELSRYGYTAVSARGRVRQEDSLLRLAYPFLPREF